MPYSTASATIRDWIPIPAFVPTSAELLEALALLPAPLIFFTVTAFPLYTSAVLLLDAAPAIPNAVLAGGIAAVVAVVGWLITRTISGFDTATKETKEAVNALTLLVTEMRLERKDDRVLTAYLKERQDKLERENEVLRNSVTTFDRYLAIQLELKKQAGQ